MARNAYGFVRNGERHIVVAESETEAVAVMERDHPRERWERASRWDEPDIDAAQTA